MHEWIALSVAAVLAAMMVISRGGRILMPLLIACVRLAGVVTMLVARLLRAAGIGPRFGKTHHGC